MTEMGTFFEYIFETRKVHDSSQDNSGIPEYGVRYVRTKKRVLVEIGDYRHMNYLQGNHWNTLLKIIQGKDLTQESLDLILDGFLQIGLHDGEHKESFLFGIEQKILKQV